MKRVFLSFCDYIPRHHFLDVKAIDAHNAAHLRHRLIISTSEISDWSHNVTERLNGYPIYDLAHGIK